MSRPLTPAHVVSTLATCLSVKEHTSYLTLLTTNQPTKQPTNIHCQLSSPLFPAHALFALSNAKSFPLLIFNPILLPKIFPPTLCGVLEHSVVQSEKKAKYKLRQLHLNVCICFYSNIHNSAFHSLRCVVCVLKEAQSTAACSFLYFSAYFLKYQSFLNTHSC